MIRKENEKKRNKERERRKRGNRKYGQAKLKHSKKGILSCCIAGAVAVVLIGLLVYAYISRGGAAPYVGGIGMIAFIAACDGCMTGFRGFRERDKNYITCKIGMAFNIFFIVGFIAIFCRGLF